MLAAILLQQKKRCFNIFMSFSLNTDFRRQKFNQGLYFSTFVVFKDLLLKRNKLRNLF